MANEMEQIEQLFNKADFSKETDLKQRLDRQLFSVRKVTLDELMKKEGLKSAKEDEKSRSRSRSAARSMDRTAEDARTLERDNPMIKKGKPPVM